MLIHYLTAVLGRDDMVSNIPSTYVRGIFITMRPTVPLTPIGIICDVLFRWIPSKF